MDYKTILAEVAGDPGCHDRLRMAATLAFTFGAHLTGVTTTGIRLGRLQGVESLARYEFGVPANRQALAHAHATLMHDMVAETGYKLTWSHEMIGEEPARALTRLGYTADILLLAQRAPWSVAYPIGADAVETTLLNCGRPVIVLPPGAYALIGGHVMVAWNDSGQASRAVADALPLLARASRITIAASHGASGIPDISDYLCCHGIAASIHRLLPGLEPAQALLEAVRTSAVDMLVAGCYGRARMRELTFGGTTRSLLQYATVPLLMSH